MIKNLVGWYALYFEIPVSIFSKKGRRLSLKIRKKIKEGLQQIKLKPVSWRNLTRHRSARIFEYDKSNGNVKLGELAILNCIASEVAADANIFEIGTFDGRTTLNLAMSSHPGCRVFTLDLKPDMDTAMDIVPSERHMVDKTSSGSRIQHYEHTHPDVFSKIQQFYGDSATFDYSPFKESCGLVFVDASHAYDYVRSDTAAALTMLKPGGIIIWHDYGVWSGVTKALEEIEDEGLDIRSIKGTSLAYYKKQD